MHLFGLTGGIASGKSTVAARFRARGLPVIDADELAREVVAPGTEGLRAIADAFGPGVLDASGALDRKALARVAFSDDEARRKLNAVTHSRITRLSMERAAELSRAGQPLACYEAALIVENGVADAFRPLVVVACPEDVQIARVRARAAPSVAGEGPRDDSGIAGEGPRDDSGIAVDALARIRAQKPLAEKVAVADFVIDTSGTLEEGARRADEALKGVCSRVGVDPGRYGL